MESCPTKTVLVIEETVAEEWQDQICNWIVDSGCLYMSSWGENCELWHDKVDQTNLSQHDYGDTPDDKFVMTTWHNSEPLEEAFWFSKFSAKHPTIELERAIIIHISNQNKEAEILKSYQWAISDEYLEETEK